MPPLCFETTGQRSHRGGPKRCSPGIFIIEAHPSIELCIDRFRLVLLYGNRLIQQLARLEQLGSPIAADGTNPWYWATEDPEGLRIDHLDRFKAFEGESASKSQSVCAQVIRLVVLLRGTIDISVYAVSQAAPRIDGHAPIHERWSTAVVIELGSLRGALLRGQGADYLPSCLPIPIEATRDGIQTALNRVARRLLELRAHRSIQPLEPPNLEDSSVACAWQQMQIYLAAIAAQFSSTGLNLVEVKAIASAAQNLFTGRPADHLPNTCLDQTCFSMCTQLQTLLGKVVRLAGRGGASAEHAAVVTEATAISDWIGGTLRPVLAEEWIEVSDSRPARNIAKETGTGTRSSRSAKSESLQWKQAALAMRKYLEQHSWPGMRGWMRVFPKFSYGIIDKAVKQTPSLRDAKKHHETQRSTRRKKSDVFVQHSSGALAKTVVAPREPNPFDRAESEALDRLLEHVPQEGIQHALDMPERDREEMIRILSEDPD